MADNASDNIADTKNYYYLSILTTLTTLKKSIPNNLLSCEDSNSSPPTFPTPAIPVDVITFLITIENCCQGCQGDADNYGAVKDVGSNNLNTGELSVENALGEQEQPHDLHHLMQIQSPITY